MYCTRNVTNSVVWVGVNDRQLTRFENLFPVPRGVCYNSYLILDEKTCLIDTVDSAAVDQFIENVAFALDGRTLDYLVINHMEPDHCSAIEHIVLRYPDVQLVGNAKTFQILKQFYNLDIDGRHIQVKANDTLSLGKHTLSFHLASMVHWPEVMITYDQTEKIVFSADIFGSFGALNGALFDDDVNYERAWAEDSRRYYANIVGKYGRQAQNTLKQLAKLDIDIICPLHGLVWRNKIDWILNKYQTWSSYTPEEQSVAIFFGSMYGNLENVCDILASKLSEAGVKDIAMYDVSATHVSQLIGETWRCSHIVLASPTYNTGIYPDMATLLHDMHALNVQNRTVGLIGSGTWASSSSKLILKELENLKNIQVLEPVVDIMSSLKVEQVADVEQLAQALVRSLGVE